MNAIAIIKCKFYTHIHISTGSCCIPATSSGGLGTSRAPGGPGKGASGGPLGCHVQDGPVTWPLWPCYLAPVPVLPGPCVTLQQRHIKNFFYMSLLADSLVVYKFHSLSVCRVKGLITNKIMIGKYLLVMNLFSNKDIPTEIHRQVGYSSSLT